MTDTSRKKPVSAPEAGTRPSGGVGRLAARLSGQGGESGSRAMRPIVPSATVTTRALIAVIAIMTFLASITIGAVSAVGNIAVEWSSDIAREVTVQVKPDERLDLPATLAKVVEVARATPGVSDARALDDRETAALLEPWLGVGLDVSSLPVPRLVVIKLGSDAGPDTLSALRASLAEQVRAASLDDHRVWSQRLSSTARTAMAIGLFILGLVVSATVLCVAVATRAAVDGARSIVEVLHFVGARDTFIVSQFQRHFLAVGLKGAAFGGGAAVLLFFLVLTLPAWFGAGQPASALVGLLTIDARGYGGILGIAVLVAMVTTLASRLTVFRTLRGID